MSQRVLILGADNFVGKRVTTALTQTDWAQPFAVSNDTLQASIDTADCVISCTMGQPSHIEAIARTLFTAAKGLVKAPRIVHVSSMTVYGSASGLVDENTPLKSDLGTYAAARIAAEQLASSCSRVVTLRPGCEYGPDCTAWSERVARWLMAKRLGDLGAAGDGYCNLLFIDDLVTAIIAAAKLPGIEGQAFNLGTSEVLTWNDYFVRFAKALGAVPVKRINQRRLRVETKLLAPPLKIMELVFGARKSQQWALPPAIPPSVLSVCSQEIKMNVSKAESMLGMHWTPVDAGLARTANWTHSQRKSR
ncbi:MAG: NAD-dependent epimerase/dehydratase family protein [Steroidobacteraceae bacterium]